jgi:hypothetical protein
VPGTEEAAPVSLARASMLARPGMPGAGSIANFTEASV